MTPWQREMRVIEAVQRSVEQARNPRLHPVEVIDHDTGKQGKVLFPMGEKL